jgi:hypothetical protein
MNAQLNSSNFKQFVVINKGKNIMFKHTDEKNVSTIVIKYVVDICDDYFTFKNNESDAKIAGFYYYSDCKMMEEKHSASGLERFIFSLFKNLFSQWDKNLKKEDKETFDFIYQRCLMTMPIGANTEAQEQKVEKQLDPEDEKIKEFLLTHLRGLTVYTREKVYRNFEYNGIIKNTVSGPCAPIVTGTCNGIATGIPLSNIHLVVCGKDCYERV